MQANLMSDNQSLSDLIQYCRLINQRGDAPATSGNFSIKASSTNAIWITQSGRHKGCLTDDFMLMQLDGSHAAHVTPSAEAKRIFNCISKQTRKPYFTVTP